MNISYSQKLWERMLGTGDLVIESAGENGHQPFTDVRDPVGVQNILYRQMEIASDGTQSRNDGMSNPQMHHEGDGSGESIPDQISKLGELRDKGVLTDQEFEQKKRQLLDRM